MNRRDVANAVSKKVDVTVSDAYAVLSSIDDVILEAVKSGEKVTLTGLVSFEKATRAERKGVNPSTQESITIPEQDYVKVKTLTRLKNAFKS